MPQSDRLPWSFAFWSSWLCYVPRVLSQESLTPSNCFCSGTSTGAMFTYDFHWPSQIESSTGKQPWTCQCLTGSRKFVLQFKHQNSRNYWISIPSIHIELTKSLEWFVFIPPIRTTCVLCKIMTINTTQISHLIVFFSLLLLLLSLPSF